MTTNPRRPRWWESPLLEAVIRWLKRLKAKRALSVRFLKGFDPAWLRWLTTLAVLCAVGSFVFDLSPAVATATTQIVFLVSAFAATGLLCVYYARLMFLRLQCSLLEWCVIIAFLGNAEGLLVATPGFAGLTALWPLTLLVAGTVLCGVVRGLVRASIWGITEPARRVWLIVAAWFSLAAPALLASGVIILVGRTFRGLVAQRFEIWGWVFGAVGLAGIAFHLWLERQTSRKARAILEAASKAGDESTLAQALASK